MNKRCDKVQMGSSTRRVTCMTEIHERQRWLRVLACARPAELEHALDGFDHDETTLRPIEVGAALVTGRVGATGAPFAFGEITVTRCVVQIGDHIGIGYVRGRAPEHARRVAIADALLQGDQRDAVQSAVIAPLSNAQIERDNNERVDVATSRVQFVTMVRGN